MQCPVPVEFCVADPLWEFRAWQAVELVEDCESRLRAAHLLSRDGPYDTKWERHE